MAAMFDAEPAEEIANVVPMEGRAKHNQFCEERDRDIYKGLAFWSPSVSISRDPRWDRDHETHGEDPYLTSRLGAVLVRGLRGDEEHLKIAACVKYFVVHSGSEALCHEF